MYYVFFRNGDHVILVADSFLLYDAIMAVCEAEGMMPHLLLSAWPYDPDQGEPES